MEKMMECLGVSIALILLCGCCCVSIPPLGGINSKFNKINKNNTYITNDVNIASKLQGGT